MSKQEIIDKFRGVVRLNEALGAIRGLHLGAFGAVLEAPERSFKPNT